VNMLKRSLVALAGIPVLLFIALRPSGTLDLVFTAVVILASLWEFLRMFGVNGAFYTSVSAITALFSIAALKYSFSLMMVYAAMVMMMLVYEALSYKKGGFESLRSIFVSFFGTFYIAYFFSFYLRLKMHSSLGGRWAAALFVLVWIIDSAAYFVGMTLGRKRNILPVSPKKSVAGFLGGLILPAAFYPLLSRFLDISPIGSIILIAVLSLCVQCGDLAESFLKRIAGVKDSGRLLGPHGGVFDRFDSMIFVLPVFYCCALLIS